MSLFLHSLSVCDASSLQVPFKHRTNGLLNGLFVMLTGAQVDLRNNDKKLPSDLTKDPEVAAMLREAGG